VSKQTACRQSLLNLCNRNFPTPQIFFFLKARKPQWGPRPPLWISSITLRHTSFGSTPLDEQSVRRRDVYLVTVQESEEIYRRLDLTIISHTPHSVGHPCTNDRSLHRPLPDNTQHSKGPNIHVPSGIRTRSPSKGAAKDPRRRSHGHWDRPP